MKIILFDIDGTLLNCLPQANIKGSEAMFKKVFNVDANEQVFYNSGKTEKGTILDILKMINYKGADDTNFNIPNHAYQVWAQETGRILSLHPPQILPGIVEMLKTLQKDKKILLSLLTGNSRFRAEEKLKAAKLDNYFRDEHESLRGAFGDISEIRTDLIDEVKSKYGDGIYIIIDDS